MTEFSRRSLFCAIPAVICAPAIVRAASLMPVKSWRGISWLESEMNEIYYMNRRWDHVVTARLWDEMYSNLETVWGPPAPGKELLAQLGSQ